MSTCPVTLALIRISYGSHIYNVLELSLQRVLVRQKVKMLVSESKDDLNLKYFGTLDQPICHLCPRTPTRQER
jgi:hypothetical protein